MEPIKRFIDSVTNGNLWMYILSLAKQDEIIESEVSKLIFEKFGFLPGDLMIRTVLYRLKKGGYASKERFKSQAAYKVTEKGLKELEAMKDYSSNLIQKL